MLLKAWARSVQVRVRAICLHRTIKGRERIFQGISQFQQFLRTDFL